MIIFTRLLFWADGFTVSPTLMLIHPRSKNDCGLIAHEKEHQKQMRSDGWIRFVLRYAFSRRWRMLYEVEAFRVSVRHGMPTKIAAKNLASKYNFKITIEQAMDLLG
jgi:hypothetical protein